MSPNDKYNFDKRKLNSDLFIQAHSSHVPFVLFSWEWLYKDIGDHVSGRNIDQFDQSLLCGLLNEVELHINVLRLIVMPWVL